MRCRSAREGIKLSAGSGSSGLQDNENTASRRLGQASFTNLMNISAGHGEQLSAVPSPSGAGFGEACSALVFQDTIQAAKKLDAAKPAFARIHHRLE